MKTRVKICGLTRLEDARYCAAAGADYLGFVLAKGSRRFVAPKAVKEIVAWVYGPETVGVFVDEDPSYVNDVALDIGLDLVQLHGNERADVCRQIDVPVIKAISVGPQSTASDLRAEIDKYEGAVAHFLFDTSFGGVSGGTGRTFDWDVIASAAVSLERAFVAGGLNAGNVGRLVERLDPFAVDVSSGVEESPGIKNFEKVSGFLETVADLSE